MAASLNTYKVHYYGEVAGKKYGSEYIKYVQAAVGDEATIKAVLTSNNVLPIGTLRIASIANVGPVATGILA